MRRHDSFVTTLAMPFRVQALIDAEKARRAERTGKRPTTRALILEALEVFLARSKETRK